MRQIGTLKLLSSKDISGSFVGIGFECADRDMIRPECCMDALGESGVKRARLSSGWAKTETQVGVFNFLWLDHIVDEMLARGVQPWFNVVYGNPLYMKDAPNPHASGCCPLEYGEEVMERWLIYVCKLAEHFRGRVTHYEIWNEACSSWFWYPGKPNMMRYAELIRRSGAAIKRADPQAKIGCNLDHRIFRDAIWYEQLFEALAPSEIDFFCFHIYTHYPELGYFPRIAHIRQTLDSLGHGSVEIWNGETGFPSFFTGFSTPIHPTKQSNEHRQAVVLARRYFLDLASGCSHTSFFTIADDWEVPYQLPNMKTTRMDAHGILNGLTYTKKEAYEVMRRIATLFSGEVVPVSHTTPVNEQDGAAEITEPLQFKMERNGAPIYAYYFPFDVEQEVETGCGFEWTITDAKLSDPILIDTMSGTAYELTDCESRENTLILRHLPIADYPLVLCDRTTYQLETSEQQRG